jgi:hypothetical protein
MRKEDPNAAAINAHVGAPVRARSPTISPVPRAVTVNIPVLFIFSGRPTGEDVH